MFKGQLDELLAQRPSLLQRDAVHQHLPAVACAPKPEQNWQDDEGLREAYLDRLWSFVERLAPAHNSLKAHVLHQRLWHDLRKGEPNKESFLRYIQLPRSGAYRNPEWIRTVRSRNEFVNARQSYPTGSARSATTAAGRGLPAALVRDRETATRATRASCRKTG